MVRAGTCGRAGSWPSDDGRNLCNSIEPATRARRRSGRGSGRGTTQQGGKRATSHRRPLHHYDTRECAKFTIFDKSNPAGIANNSVAARNRAQKQLATTTRRMANPTHLAIDSALAPRPRCLHKNGAKSG